jgi:predicted aspartyl protease
MSTFRYSIEIGDTGQQRFERLEAWVDSGASYTWIPQPILEDLGYSPTGRRRFRLANGETIERDICRVYLRIGQDVEFTLCVFGDDDSLPLLGATALEEFALGVDPIHHTLVPVVPYGRSMLRPYAGNPEA